METNINQVESVQNEVEIVQKTTTETTPETTQPSNEKEIDVESMPVQSEQPKLTIFETLEGEIKKLKTATDIEKFYVDQLKDTTDKDEESALEICRSLYKIACSNGNFKLVSLLTYSTLSKAFFEIDGKVITDFFNVSAQSNQLEVLKYQLWSFKGIHFSENLIEIDLTSLYKKGLYEMFVFVLDTIKYQDDYSEAFMIKLNELKKDMETNYSYVNYLVTNKYLIKTIEVIDMMTKLDDIFKIRETPDKLANIKW